MMPKRHLDTRNSISRFWETVRCIRTAGLRAGDWIKFPGNSVQSPARNPAVLIHRAVSQNLEILLRVSRWRFGIIERRKKTYAMHRHLCDAVNFLRLRQAGGFQNGWRDVGTVSELAAQTAFLLNAFGPG